MTVVVLPVVLMTMRRRVALETWLSAVCVLVGIVLALGPSVRASQTAGLAVMCAGCLLRAIGIVMLADLAKKRDPIAIVVLVQGFAAIISLAGWFATDPRLFFGLPVSRTLVAAE